MTVLIESFYLYSLTIGGGHAIIMKARIWSKPLKFCTEDVCMPSHLNFCVDNMCSKLAIVWKKKQGSFNIV